MTQLTSARLIVAFSNNALLDETEEMSVEVYAVNGHSLDAFWREALWAPPAAEGPSKIRGGYDYREPYNAPCLAQPHSVCPGDRFVDDAGHVVFCEEYPG